MRYSARKVEVEAAEPHVLALWRAQWPARERAAVFRWYYRGSPNGPANCFLLDHGDEVVGMAALAERRFAVCSASLTAGLMGDFLIDRQHRTLFPALSLQRGLVAWARARFGLIYGLPNASSAAVLGRLGFRPLAKLVRYVYILRHATYARSVIERNVPMAAPLGGVAGPAVDAWRRFVDPGTARARPELVPIAAPDAEFDTLWRTRTFRPPIIAERSAAFLRWRFTERPDERCEIFTLQKPTLAAYAVVHSGSEHAHIRDLMGVSVDAIARILPPLCEAMRARGLRTVSFSCAAPPEVIECLRDLHFHRRNERALIGLRGAGDRLGDAFWSDPRNWYATEADEDQ